MEHYSKIRLIAMTDGVITDMHNIQKFLASPPNPLGGPLDLLAGNVLVLALVVEEILKKLE